MSGAEIGILGAVGMKTLYTFAFASMMGVNVGLHAGPPLMMKAASWWYKKRYAFKDFPKGTRGYYAVLCWIETFLHEITGSEHMATTETVGDRDIDLPYINEDVEIRTPYGTLELTVIGQVVGNQTSISGIRLAVYRRDYWFWDDKDAINHLHWQVHQIYENCSITCKQRFTSTKPKVINKNCKPRFIKTVINEAATESKKDV